MLETTKWKVIVEQTVRHKNDVIVAIIVPSSKQKWSKWHIIKLLMLCYVMVQHWHSCCHKKNVHEYIIYIIRKCMSIYQRMDTWYETIWIRRCWIYTATCCRGNCISCNVILLLKIHTFINFWWCKHNLDPGCLQCSRYVDRLILSCKITKHSNLHKGWCIYETFFFYICTAPSLVKNMGWNSWCMIYSWYNYCLYEQRLLCVDSFKTCSTASNWYTNED